MGLLIGLLLHFSIVFHFVDSGKFCCLSLMLSAIYNYCIQLLNMNLSGTLAPELGQLSHLKILHFMWNELTGNIPKEIGHISTLRLL
ncbi:hypothetical protein ES319_D09G111200v1 [Gossypium barbadense]|uniref:Leucine-rich repeat-containing N-terminal plant-type domain-containing protein n=2 Tax=Gossypium TaxID=3633 RepID=A0A5J5Q3M4_GOSBA|nr:hypothetical protein ES319_D09G111200v1 [Gossypium barbadense]TYG53634.1 hypothetical protein ES288_D09G125200v1 [Gossypium darwinii]